MRRIMVINDTREILDLFREILTDEGYEVYLYSYAVEDINEIERIQPDLIILDQMFGEERLAGSCCKSSRCVALRPLFL